jgi:hypothetical protein
MVTLVGNDGFIYTAKDKEQLDQLLQRKETVKTEVRKSRKSDICQKLF